VTKLALGAHPFLLGFEDLERLVERTAKADQAGYPPYNIEHTGENSYRITLAVAGFAETDLSITVEDSQLVVRGRIGENDGDRVYLHRGIATRQFQRVFVLADGVGVTGASLDNGLLHVDLERRVPEAVVKTISINRAGK
jgi:HSP20 family molecular chaperone IbpA